MRILYTLYQGLFGISLFVHFLTFFGVSPLDRIPGAWSLHLGLFVIPVFEMLLDALSRIKGHPPPQPSKVVWAWAWTQLDVPSWIKKICAGLLAYTVLSFFFSICILNEGGSPSVINGQKVLHSHGHVIRVLTDTEYDWHRAYSDRAISSFWIALYALSMGNILDSIRRADLTKRNISSDHPNT